MDRDRDLRAAAGQRLVDGVVDDLVDEVMQTALTGRADVHARPLADRLESLENGDVLCVVTGIAGARAGALVVRHDPPMTLTRPGPAPGQARRGVRNGVQKNSTEVRSKRPRRRAPFACKTPKNVLPGQAAQRPPATHLSRDIPPEANAPLRRSRIGHGHQVELLGPYRRRTGDGDHPAALGGRLRLSRDRGPHDLGPGPLHLGQQRLRRELIGEHGQRRLHRARRAAVMRHRAPAMASARTSPSVTSSRRTRRLLGARDLLEIGGGDHRLAVAGAQQLDQRPAAAAIELAHHVVEQHQRRRCGGGWPAPRARPAAGRAAPGAAVPGSRRRAAHVPPGWRRGRRGGDHGR